MNKINVALYGGFDKKSKNHAEIIYCDKCEHCSFYKKKQCLNVTHGFSHSCKYGTVQSISGYTQRAKKKYEFDLKYKTDECYHALEYPHDWRVSLIDNTVVFNLTYAICDKKYYNNYKHEWETLDHYIVREAGFGTTYSYISLEDLTSDVLNRILSYKPLTWLDHAKITEYQKKIVPNILLDLSKLLPYKYNKLIEDYPQYKDTVPNYIGRNAYIRTLRDGIKLGSYYGIFIKEGNDLICTNYKSAFLPFDSKQAEMRIKITNDMTYSITDNNQVDENTEFK